MAILPGMLRPAQEGVQGLKKNAISDELRWTCAFCSAERIVPYDPERQLLPEGWAHVLVQVPGVSRVSLYCASCCAELRLRDVIDFEREAHLAWLEAEKAWVAEQIGDRRAMLEKERARVESELSALAAEEKPDGS